MEHLLIQGGETYLPFARSRIKALKALGLDYADQSFEVDGVSIRVSITPEHEYVFLSGGGVGMRKYREYRCDLDAIRIKLQGSFLRLDNPYLGPGSAKVGLVSPNGRSAYVYRTGKLVFTELVDGNVVDVAEELLVDIPGNELILHANFSGEVGSTCSKLPAIVLSPPVQDSWFGESDPRFCNYRVVWLEKTGNGFLKRSFVLTDQNQHSQVDTFPLRYESSSSQTAPAIVATKYGIYCVYRISTLSITSSLSLYQGEYIPLELISYNATSKLTFANAETGVKVDILGGENPLYSYSCILAPDQKSSKCLLYILEKQTTSGTSDYALELKLHIYGETHSELLLFKASWVAGVWTLDFAIDPSFSIETVNRVFLDRGDVGLFMSGFTRGNVSVGVKSWTSEDRCAAIFTNKVASGGQPAVHKLSIAPDISYAAYISAGKLYGETNLSKMVIYSIDETDTDNPSQAKLIPYTDPEGNGPLINMTVGDGRKTSKDAQ